MFQLHGSAAVIPDGYWQMNCSVLVHWLSLSKPDFVMRIALPQFPVLLSLYVRLLVNLFPFVDQIHNSSDVEYLASDLTSKLSITVVELNTMIKKRLPFVKRYVFHSWKLVFLTMQTASLFG